MKKTEMFVITHKKLFLKIPRGYNIIGVGKYGRESTPYILNDAVGDNISKKNSNYCELTAIYWIWKNYELPDYIGEMILHSWNLQNDEIVLNVDSETV